MNYEYDENNWIKDTDPLYETLDQWHENDEYDNILNTILEIEREHWSNKLWFRVISALNNKKMFERAEEEISRLSERCEKPADIAKLHYMKGYIYYMTDREYRAIECYQKGMTADPENTAELSLQEDCEECQKYIDDNLKTLRDFAIALTNSISQVSVSQAEKEKVSGEKFTMFLAFLPGIRKVPQLERCIGFEKMFYKYEEEERGFVKEHLAEQFGITNYSSLKKYYTDNNVNYVYEDVCALKAGNLQFLPEDLTVEGRTVWKASVDYLSNILEYLPQGGIAAWDISETLGLARHAYGCSLLSDTEYTQILKELTDIAKQLYRSWEEYMAGLLFGAGYFMFRISELNLLEAIKMMTNMSKLVLDSDLPAICWEVQIENKWSSYREDGSFVSNAKSYVSNWMRSLP